MSGWSNTASMASRSLVGAPKQLAGGAPPLVVAIPILLWVIGSASVTVVVVRGDAHRVALA